MELDWNEVYASHYDRVFGYVYRKLGHAEDARDITADTFLKAMEAECRGHGCNSIETLEPWLRRIARNTMFDHLRYIQRRTIRALDATAFGVVDPSPSPYEEAVASILLDSLRRAMSLLPRPQRHVITMHADGYCLHEIDQELGIANGTVKSRLHRARAGLKEYSMLSKE